MERFDDCVRSERYFTATLLPLILAHDEFRGARRFVELVEARARTERDPSGLTRPKQPAAYAFDDLELITEFHIARDLGHYGHPLAPGETGADTVERRDAPDLVLVLGRELVVVEAKFFSTWQPTEFQTQLRSQRRQVRHLFAARPTLRAWRHVALLPDTPAGIDCDALLTWGDVAVLSDEILGPTHYVSRRLRAAVARVARSNGGGAGVPNYEARVTLDEVLRMCRERGDEIFVGHTGGEADLRARGAAYARQKPWKWRQADTGGTVDPANWIAGSRFVRLVESLPTYASATATTTSARVQNYDC